MGLALDALGETTAAISHYEQATRLDSQNEQYAACYHAALDASIPPKQFAGCSRTRKYRFRQFRRFDRRSRWTQSDRS